MRARSCVVCSGADGSGWRDVGVDGGGVDDVGGVDVAAVVVVAAVGEDDIVSVEGAGGGDNAGDIVVIAAAVGVSVDIDGAGVAGGAAAVVAVAIAVVVETRSRRGVRNVGGAGLRVVEVEGEGMHWVFERKRAPHHVGTSRVGTENVSQEGCRLGAVVRRRPGKCLAQGRLTGRGRRRGLGRRSCRGCGCGGCRRAGHDAAAVGVVECVGNFVDRTRSRRGVRGSLSVVTVEVEEVRYALGRKGLRLVGAFRAVLKNGWKVVGWAR